MIAIHLGFFTIVIGRGAVTLHPYTRGTVDVDAPLFGITIPRRKKVASR